MNPTISVVLATFNEEKNVARCLESVKAWADEIVVADGESSDATQEIAKRYGAAVIVTDNKPIFHINKNIAIDAATKGWVLQLDADEVVSNELRDEILAKIASNPKENGFWIPRSNYFLGRFLKKGGQYPDATNRLYRRGKGRLPAKDVHEQALIEGETGWLTNDLLHFADPSFSRYLTRWNRYTTLLAQELIDGRRKLQKPELLCYFLFLPKWEFWKIYLRHRGYVDGFPGFVFALFSALRFPAAYIKYWERKQKSEDKINLADWE